MEFSKEIEELKLEFINSRNVLIALGDENRQHMILKMMESGNCKGLRVGEITNKTSLFRPAVSHHLKILKDAKIIKMRKEGTKNYYYFDVDVFAIDNLKTMIIHIEEIMQVLKVKRNKND